MIQYTRTSEIKTQDQKSTSQATKQRTVRHEQNYE